MVALATRWLYSLSTVEVALPAAVLLLVAGRVYYGSVLFSPQLLPVWAAVRRVATPVVETLLTRIAPIPVSLESETPKREYVGAVDLSPKALALAVDGDRAVEIPLLATYSTDWDGNSERGTFVWYCGSAPGSFPRWLRPHQVHIRCYEVADRTRVTAHFEPNSYRPDTWLSFISGSATKADNGVQRATRAITDAGIELHNTQTQVEGV